MPARVPNVSKGRFAYYASLPATNDALILVLIKDGGASDLDALEDLDSLGAILAASNDECDFTGYARRTLSGVSSAPNDSTNRMVVDATDPASWTNGGGTAQASAYGVICYDPDTTTGDDDDLIPISVFDAVITFDPGVETSLQFHADGVAYAANPA